MTDCRIQSEIEKIFFCKNNSSLQDFLWTKLKFEAWNYFFKKYFITQFYVSWMLTRITFKNSNKRRQN